MGQQLLPFPSGKVQALPQATGAGHKRRIPVAVVLPRPARGAGTLIPSAQRLVWAAKQLLGSAALGALFAWQRALLAGGFSSLLENPRDGGAWWAAIYGVAQSWTRLNRLSSCSSSP